MEGRFPAYEQAESSNAVEIHAENRTLSNHMFLHFGRTYLERFQVLRQREVETIRGIDWEFVNKMGERKRLAALLLPESEHLTLSQPQTPSVYQSLSPLPPEEVQWLYEFLIDNIFFHCKSS
jgi:hypothetical protein